MSVASATVPSVPITVSTVNVNGIRAAARKGMLPWFNAHVEDTLDLMGEDFWPYGVEKNRNVLDVFLRYHHEQGLSPRKLEVDEMFAPETYEEFVI